MFYDIRMNPFDNSSELWTVEEAAKFLGVGVETIRTYANRKINPLPIIIISPKIIRIIKHDFLEWVKGQEQNYLDNAVLDNKIFKDENEKV